MSVEFEDEMIAWATAAVAEGAMLLHKQHLVAGKANAVYDGREEGQRKDGCTLPVIEFENGHSFIANPVHFVKLGAAETAFFMIVSNDINALVHRAAEVAALARIEPKSSFDLLVAALRSANRMLQRGEQE